MAVGVGVEDVGGRWLRCVPTALPPPANLTAVMEEECSSNVCCRLYSRPASRTWMSRSRLADASSFRPGVQRTPSARACPQQAPIWARRKACRNRAP